MARSIVAARRDRDPDIGDDEALVGVHAASVDPDVWHVVRGGRCVEADGRGLRRRQRRVPGTECRAASRWSDAKTSHPVARGMYVFGECPEGPPSGATGGRVRRIRGSPGKTRWSQPSSLMFAQAAAVPTSGLIALRSVTEGGEVRAGHAVLVNGAGGGVGIPPSTSRRPTARTRPASTRRASSR